MSRANIIWKLETIHTKIRHKKKRKCIELNFKPMKTQYSREEESWTKSNILENIKI